MKYVSLHVINYQHVFITFFITIKVAVVREVCRLKYSMFGTFFITLSGPWYSTCQIVLFFVLL